MAEIGGAALNEIKQWKFIDEKKDDDEIKVKFSQKVPSGMGLSHYTLLKKVVKKMVDKEDKEIISGEESLNTTRLIHAIYKSDEEKKWIDLSQNPVSSRLGKNN